MTFFTTSLHLLWSLPLLLLTFLILSLLVTPIENLSILNSTSTSTSVFILKAFISVAQTSIYLYCSCVFRLSHYLLFLHVTPDWLHYVEIKARGGYTVCCRSSEVFMTLAVCLGSLSCCRRCADATLLESPLTAFKVFWLFTLFPVRLPWQAAWRHLSMCKPGKCSDTQRGKGSTSTRRCSWRRGSAWWLPGPSRRRSLLHSSWWSGATLWPDQSLWSSGFCHSGHPAPPAAEWGLRMRRKENRREELSL